MRPVIAVLGLLVSTNLASAADLGGHYDQYGGSLKDAPIVVAPLTWTGLYVGAHAGWVTGGWAGNMEYSGTSPDGWIFDDSTKKLKDNDWGGGLQIGFNRQHGSLVWGLEADISWVHLEDSREFKAYRNDPEVGWALDAEARYFGTVRGRIGFLATPKLLLYGTGGGAWGKAKIHKETRLYDDDGSFNRVSGWGSADENHLGWAAGLGGEFMVTDNWIVRGEWLHVDLGKERYHLKGVTRSGAPFLSDSFPADLEFDVFRVGVNYKFAN